MNQGSNIVKISYKIVVVDLDLMNPCCWGLNLDLKWCKILMYDNFKYFGKGIENGGRSVVIY
jgi:hypothetical protein